MHATELQQMQLSANLSQDGKEAPEDAAVAAEEEAGEGVTGLRRAKMCVCVCVCIHTYINTYIHTYIHTPRIHACQGTRELTHSRTSYLLLPYTTIMISVRIRIAAMCVSPYV